MHGCQHLPSNDTRYLRTAEQVETLNPQHSLSLDKSILTHMTQVSSAAQFRRLPINMESMSSRIRVINDSPSGSEEGTKKKKA